MITSKEIGKKFKEEREKQGLSLDEVAQDSGIHQKVLQDIENGIFDRIGGVYIKSFIKKYSLFLEMNIAEILKLYEEVSSELPNKEFRVDNNYKKENNEDLVESDSKKIQFLFIGVLLVVLVILVFVFIGMLRSKIKAKPQSQSIKTSSLKTIPEVKPKPVEKTGFFNRKKISDKFSLQLKANGDVWVQIEKGETLIYSGIIIKGKSLSWEFDSQVNIRTGKAEYLEYIIDGKNLGVLSAGVVKDIIVSGLGVKINNKWAAQTE